MREFAAVIIALAIACSVYIYSNAQVRITVINNCTKLAGEYMRFRIDNDGCQVGEWKVRP